MRAAFRVCLIVAGTFLSSRGSAQQISPSAFAELHWRSIRENSSCSGGIEIKAFSTLNLTGPPSPATLGRRWSFCASSCRGRWICAG